MSRRELSRTINDGGRIDPTSKMYGGIAFTGNTTATVIAAQNEGTRIISTPAYTTILPNDFINAYWELVGTSTPVQALKYHGSHGWLTAHFGATVSTAAANDVVIRLVRQSYAANGAALTPVAVMPQTISAAVASQKFGGRFTTLIEVNPLDEFYIDVANATTIANITVFSSDLVITQ
jgi:hypothetical protein